MSERLPLGALRVFETAHRLGSFLRAAEELGVTPGAVSRQIKALETELGTRLFDRFNRAVRPTEAGETLALGVRRGLATLSAAVEEVRHARDAPLVVSVMHSLAARWLAPRLHHFEARHPEVQVLLSASDVAVDLARDNVDLAIRHGKGPYPGLHVTPLFHTVLFPVCSPRLLEALRLDKPSDLAGAVLLRDVKMRFGEPSWREWLDAAGAGEVDASAGPQFSNTYLAIEAAVAGRGVAMAAEAMALDDLAAGRLVKPFDFTFESPYSTWALSLPEKADRPAIRKFRAWLLAQAKADGLTLFE
ncbi:transcriptional regulator GcvA [Phenylobacterium sp.]|uniref:transcriptional regulator GcvA n=1 Tax=Phenylobacterium sp. TaxID=1871053 RepID=UPI0035B0D2BD